ncbi:hypothetical protein [Agaribacterium sp. ZY112]|uniref:hypothetical protein n=1 Tax=Agaribacterium sp. ZY112 TaxID=3233574 RepID=UPI003523C168
MGERKAKFPGAGLSELKELLNSIKSYIDLDTNPKDSKEFDRLFKLIHDAEDFATDTEISLIHSKVVNFVHFLRPKLESKAQWIAIKDKIHQQISRNKKGSKKKKTSETTHKPESKILKTLRRALHDDSETKNNNVQITLFLIDQIVQRDSFLDNLKKQCRKLSRETFDKTITFETLLDIISKCIDTREFNSKYPFHSDKKHLRALRLTLEKYDSSYADYQRSIDSTKPKTFERFYRLLGRDINLLKVGESAFYEEADLNIELGYGSEHDPNDNFEDFDD